MKDGLACSVSGSLTKSEADCEIVFGFLAGHVP